MKMKRCVLSLLLLFALSLLESCDYWGDFIFVIENTTDNVVSLSYREQFQRYEDILPTYNHGEDYQLAISDQTTVITIEPNKSRTFIYDVGLVDSSFPTEEDTPRAYGISPFWERIKYIVIGSDTILTSEYSEEKWMRRKNQYTLRLLPEMCDKKDNPDPNLDKQESTIDSISWKDWPHTDCSTSTRPVRDLVAYKLLGVQYQWEVDWMSGTTYIIAPNFGEESSEFTYKEYLEQNLCSGTHEAYLNLIEGNTDVIIASRDISRNELQSSVEQGVEIETTPLAIDALVFIVNPNNPVTNLTSDQIRKIYTGEITNWKEVGGVDHAITPYIRNTDSGSQEKMETLVMNGLTMINGTYMPEIIGSQMASPYMQLEYDEYGIGYTPYFYCTAMVRDLMKVNILSIDGVSATKETLRENRYPFTSHIYAAVRKTQDHNSTAYKLYRFLFTEKSADIIDESGYIAVR